jgi:hypothetical protein
VDSSESEDVQPEAQDLGPFSIIAMFREPRDGHSFLLSMSGKLLGYLFRCRFGVQETQILPGVTGGVNFAGHSQSGSHFLAGSCDGAVRVTCVSDFELPKDGDTFWEAQVHDMHHSVVSVQMAFDGSSITSAATDASVFSYDLKADEMEPGQFQSGRMNNEIGCLDDCEPRECHDITDPMAYTIEQAKKRLEADTIQAAAERKKMSVRESLQQYVELSCIKVSIWRVAHESLSITKTTIRASLCRIKREFQELLEENEAKPEAERLPLSYFDIDPEVKDIIEQEIQQQEQLVREEMQFTLEKQSIALAKIKGMVDVTPIEICTM